MCFRIKGKLEKFDHSPLTCHGYVRLLSGELLHVPGIKRGVLGEGGLISPCNDASRYEKITPGTVVALDVEYDRKGENPFPVAWAPAH